MLAIVYGGIKNKLFCREGTSSPGKVLASDRLRGQYIGASA